MGTWKLWYYNRKETCYDILFFMMSQDLIQMQSNILYKILKKVLKCNSLR